MAHGMLIAHRLCAMKNVLDDLVSLGKTKRNKVKWNSYCDIVVSFMNLQKKGLVGQFPQVIW